MATKKKRRKPKGPSWSKVQVRLKQSHVPFSTKSATRVVRARRRITYGPYKGRRLTRRSRQYKIHGFVSDAQRKAVHAMLAAKRNKKMIVYHGTIVSKGSKGPFHNQLAMGSGVHAGTEAAAFERLIERGRAKYGSSIQDQQFLMYKLEVPVNKPMFLKVKAPKYKDAVREPGLRVFDERAGGGDLFNDTFVRGNTKVIRGLRRRGYDIVPYINDVEDQGALSVFVVDPKKIKVLEKRRIANAKTMKKLYIDSFNKGQWAVDKPFAKRFGAEKQRRKRGPQAGHLRDLKHWEAQE